MTATPGPMDPAVAAELAAICRTARARTPLRDPDCIFGADSRHVCRNHGNDLLRPGQTCAISAEAVADAEWAARRANRKRASGQR